MSKLLAASLSTDLSVVCAGMKLQNEVKFKPGYYLASFSNGSGIVIEDPEYDPTCNVMTGSKVAVDGLDNDGSTVYIDMDDVRIFELINEAKLNYAKQNSIAKTNVMRVKAQIELVQVMKLGLECKVVQGFNPNHPPPVGAVLPDGDPNEDHNKSKGVEEGQEVEVGKIAPPSR